MINLIHTPGYHMNLIPWRRPYEQSWLLESSGERWAVKAARPASAAPPKRGTWTWRTLNRLRRRRFQPAVVVSEAGEKEVKVHLEDWRVTHSSCLLLFFLSHFIDGVHSAWFISSPDAGRSDESQFGIYTFQPGAFRVQLDKWASKEDDDTQRHKTSR